MSQSNHYEPVIVRDEAKRKGEPILGLPSFSSLSPRERKESEQTEQEQKDKKSTNTNKILASTNEGKTTAVVSDVEVLFIVSMEDVCLFTSSSSDWIHEFGASDHVTPCKDNFVSYKILDYGRVQLRNNHYCNIVGVGDVRMRIKDGNNILLKQARHVP